MAKRFTTVTDSQAAKSLARRFIPLADSLRDLLTKFGLRSYKVTRVRIEWSGGRRGNGTPVVTLEEEMQPTPKIELDGLQSLLQPVGMSEQGSITLSQVSGRFSETDLRGFPSSSESLQPHEEFFYEIQFFPTNGPTHRRRFYPRGAPSYFPGKLQWTIRLEKADSDREESGEPAGP
jgi:hypothetical protein